MAFSLKNKRGNIFVFWLLDTLTFDQYMLFFENVLMDFH